MGLRSLMSDYSRCYRRPDDCQRAMAVIIGALRWRLFASPLAALYERRISRGLWRAKHFCRRARPYHCLEDDVRDYMHIASIATLLPPLLTWPTRDYLTMALLRLR